MSLHVLNTCGGPHQVIKFYCNILIPTVRDMILVKKVIKGASPGDPSSRYKIVRTRIRIFNAVVHSTFVLVKVSDK